jgi:predicted  nucleic acid-binding Zn-ribbon protein
MVTENQLDKLRTLQNILTEKIQLEHEIQEIPKQLGALDEAHNRTRKAFIEKNLEHEKIKSAEQDARTILDEAEAAREKAERTISEINTQREYEALDKERHAAEEKEQQYRKEVQQKERQLLELEEQIKQYGALIEQQEQELAEKRAGIEAEVSEKNKQVEALLKQENKLTDDLDPEVVFKFERIIRNKEDGVGIVSIRGNVCMGCHMILPAQFSNNVRIGEEFVFCPYCSRILYYEESPEDEEVFFDAEDSGALYDPDEEDEDFEEDEKEEEKLVNIDFEE